MPQKLKMEEKVREGGKALRQTCPAIISFEIENDIFIKKKKGKFIVSLSRYRVSWVSL